MNWSGTNSYVYFVAIFMLFINPFGVKSYKTFSHNETDPGYRIHQILTYRDGSSLIYLTKPINETCNEPRIDLRVLRQYGAVDNIQVRHSIPDFNFCLKPSPHIMIFGNMMENTLILYENSTDINSASFYVLLVNARTGNVISNTFLSPVSVINGILSSSGNILPHFNEEHGFLFWSYLTETSVQWIYFSKPDPNGNFKPINNNKFELSNPLDRFNIFVAVDGTFGLVTSTYTNTSNQVSQVDLIDPTELTFELYVTFIKPSDTVDGPYLLYQTAIPNLQIVFQCDSIYMTVGYFCILNMKEVQPKGKFEKYLIKITFQHTGSVVDTENFSNLELYPELYKDLSENTIFESLYHGGFLVLFKNLENNLNKSIQAIILDNNGIYNSILNLPENLITPNRFALPGFRDSSFVIAQQENEYTWNVYWDDYPKFVYYDDGYDTPYIKSTYPLINSIVSLSTNNIINITYKSPIMISTNNISIYQYNNENPILRQSVPGSSLFLSNSADNQTLILNVLESTFNQPNTKYYIVIDDNVVQDWETNQPLLGLESNIWVFNTTNNQDIYAEGAIGLFSLTTEGTKYYESLSPYGQNIFLSQLRNDLAESIPVNIDRLDSIEYYKRDETQNPPKIILKLPIKPTQNLNERNVDRIIKDLDILIKEQDITPISWFNTTKLLDANFGFQRERNFISDYKFHLIGIVIGIIILGLLYFYAKRRHPKGENIEIFRISLIIMDFVMDLLFVLNNGRNVPQLFIPSIIFCAVPLVINSIVSMIIMLQEITRNESFYKWFKLNTNIAALFTILASTDLEVLKTLSSQVAGIKLFNAPISEKSQSNIFWGSLIGFFIEDIPQFIIQIFYVKYTVTYDIIPILTLLTNSMILTTSVLSKVYHLIAHSRAKRRVSMVLPIDQKLTFGSDIEKIENSLAVPQAAKMYYRRSV
ncbi:hypothetical protein RclHR1_15380003 [Rhizophagus clarus]|uniref:Uncharacterized protein n=1 Tax=Rhizophagus clarus TaxID=94130 RepID=A0A2Z6QGP3_9GLOM|nr:hypothetical protein RclHR1_15380003 [Rhizophagus clarus]GES98496.1 hypothetical protein GLOIN_2v1693119 [Rhizophagus clarus]